MTDAMKNQLIEVLREQDSILDSMLHYQKEIHQAMKERNWVELQNCIYEVRILSDKFVASDQKRESLSAGNKGIYYDKDVQGVFTQVRTKLSRSKIENDALNKYVDTTRAFIEGVLDECVPSKKNMIYNSKGFVKPEIRSVVLDRVF